MRLIALIFALNCEQFWYKKKHYDLNHRQIICAQSYRTFFIVPKQKIL